MVVEVLLSIKYFISCILSRAMFFRYFVPSYVHALWREKAKALHYNIKIYVNSSELELLGFLSVVIMQNAIVTHSEKMILI